jgi:ribosome modulation factor
MMRAPKKITMVQASEAYHRGYTDGQAGRVDNVDQYTSIRLRNAYLQGRARGQFNNYLGK